MSTVAGSSPAPLRSRLVELVATSAVSAMVAAIVAYFLFRPEVYAHFSCKSYEGAAPFTVECYDESLYATDVIWDFGDGSPSKRGSDSVYTYASASITPYVIRLTAIGKGRHESERTITVRQATALVNPQSVSIAALKASTLEQTTKQCDVSFINDQHASTFGESTRNFQEACVADQGFKISSARFMPVSQTRASVSPLAVSADGTRADLTARITAGPLVDRYRGWLHGRIELVQERKSSESSIALAENLNVETYGLHELGKSVTPESIQGFKLNVGSADPVTLKLGEAYTDYSSSIRYSLAERENRLFLSVQPVSQTAAPRN
jgi:hypothetical protein